MKGISMSKDDQHNVTKRNFSIGKVVTILKNESENKYFPCPICNKKLLVKFTKKSKPYIICNSCGIQMFIRNKEGINKFYEILSFSKL